MTPSRLPWAGYRPLRKGKIHVFCPRCHRRHSNGERGEYDPPRAELVHTWCERCGQGGKDAPEYFLDAHGREIGWDEIERHMNRVLNAKRIR